jgi:SOS-response transcriptional repressor LexA
MSSINSESPKYPGLIRRMESALGTTKTNEIARLLKVSSSLVSDWRAKRSIPGLPQLLETARRGHTTVDWLLTGSGLRTLTISADDEDNELLNTSERAFIETAARRSKEPITHTLRSLIHDGLAARGFTPYAIDVIAPVLACLDTFPERTRARTTELLGMALAARLRGRVQDWSLRPNEWQSIRDIELNADSAGSDARRAVSKLRQHLKSLSTPRAKGDAFPASHMLVVAGQVRTREMPLVGEITASGAVKTFRVFKTAKVPDVFHHNKSRGYYVLRARGNSMAGDGIGAGTLLVYKDQKDACDGQMVVALVSGHMMVNWFYHEGSRVRLQPLNLYHSPFYVEHEQQVDVKGIIVGIVQPPI